MKYLKYTELLSLNNQLKKEEGGKEINISILSNIIVHYSKDVLEYALRKRKFNPTIEIGDYDNILQTAPQVADTDVVIIFWEAANFVDGFQYKAEIWSDKELEALENKIKGEIDLTLNSLSKTRLVLFTTFSDTIFNQYRLRDNNLSLMVQSLNNYIQSRVSSNIRLIDLEKVLAQVSIKEAVRLRDYYSSKSLYSVNFYQAYVEQILPYIMASQGKAKKAIIFDCDNTLWKGVVGEDGFDGIKMSSASKTGAPFEEVHYLVKMLAQKGIIVGLCSKNNFDDVENVIVNHPDFKITNEEIVIKRVNWQDKATNLQEMANQLNIGIDSFVFVDDSNFEVNLIRERLPEVEVVQVPKRLHTYPDLIRQTIRHFFNLSETKEDLKKVKMYKQQAERKTSKQGFSDIADYLRSLELELDVYINHQPIIPRMSQMSQKTNQFNLTTKRYTEQDIINFTESESVATLAMRVKDKFGDSGITGMCIVKNVDEKEVEIDTFLMSCRVLGRNMEYKFMDFIIEFLSSKGCEKVIANFSRTKKNKQVEDLYDRYGFTMIEGDMDNKSYELHINNYRLKNIDYIKVNRHEE